MPALQWGGVSAVRIHPPQYTLQLCDALSVCTKHSFPSPDWPVSIAVLSVRLAGLLCIAMETTKCTGEVK